MGHDLQKHLVCVWCVLSLEMSAENDEEVPDKRPVPRLNERILSSLSRRSVAAHPWHDLEIGTLVHMLRHWYLI